MIRGTAFELVGNLGFSLCSTSYMTLGKLFNPVYLIYEMGMIITTLKDCYKIGIK